MFCNCDLAINPMTLKLEDDLDSLKLYLYTENETTSLRHSKLRAGIRENTKYTQGQNIKSYELLQALS